MYNKRKNLKTDLGFTFSFISTDLEKIFPLSKELKKEFIKDLNKLIENYAKKTDDNVDFFFDEALDSSSCRFASSKC